jgi:hypothetical protein
MEVPTEAQRVQASRFSHEAIELLQLWQSRWFDATIFLKYCDHFLPEKVNTLAHRSSNTFAAVVAVVCIAAMFKKSILFINRSGSRSRPWAESTSHCNISCRSLLFPELRSSNGGRRIGEARQIDLGAGDRISRTVPQQDEQWLGR